METFLLIAVAEESGAQVRQLYAQPDEHPGLLIGDGVQALYELVEQVVKKGRTSWKHARRTGRRLRLC